MRIIKLFRACGAFALLLGAMTAGAQIHKWVDANGVTHYSEKPPADGKSKSIELREATPRSTGSSAPAPASASLKDRETEYRKRQTQREQTEAAAAQEKERRDAVCKKARAQLINLQTTSRMYNLNDRGERVFMSAAERDTSVALYEAEVNRNCNG